MKNKNLPKVIILLVGAVAVLVGLNIFFADDFNPTNQQEQLVVEEINILRTQNGLPELRVNPSLQNAARQKAQHMFTHNYWGHELPDGPNPWEFIVHDDYLYDAAGENLARGFSKVDDIANAWYLSLSHRQNLLNPLYEEIGLVHAYGELNGKRTTLTVAYFADPAENGQVQVGEAVRGPDFEASHFAQPAKVSLDPLRVISLFFAPLNLLSRLLFGALIICNAALILIELRTRSKAGLQRAWLLLGLSAAVLVLLLVSNSRAIL